MEYDCYIASGWFSPQQAADLGLIKKACTKLGIKYFSPKDSNLVSSLSSVADREKAFVGNLEAIKSSKFIIANTRDKDMGTVFEAGYAYGIGKPIIYYCEGLNGKFNLMLSQSGSCVATNEKELNMCIAAISKTSYYRQRYEGEIE